MSRISANMGRSRYAEVLENTHLTLIATIHKLYSMVRHSKPWEHGEPGFNCLGQPVVQSIAQKLGCLRINHDIDLPVDSAFPEDESSMAELSRQLEEQQAHEQDAATSAIRAYNRAAPQSFASDNDFGSSKTLANLESTAISSAHSSSMPDFSSSCASVAKTEQQNSHNAISVLFTQQTSLLQNLAMMRQDALDVDFGTTKPDSLFYANADVTMGMADFVIYPNCDNESK